MTQLRQLSDQMLLESVRRAAALEREATREVLLHLLEVERRRFYLDRGYPSLFEFCVQELGYCAGSAQIRIQSMRLLRDIPQEATRREVMDKLDSGALKLTQLATVQKLSRAVKAETGRKVAPKEKLALLEQIEGQTTRETEKTVARVLEIPSFSEGTELKLCLDAEALELLREFQALTSHSNPNGDASLTFKQAMKLGLEIIKKKKGLSETKPSTSSHEVEGPTRVVKAGSIVSRQTAIPQPNQRRVWQEARAQCSYVDSKTGRRCTSRHFLQIDHIHPRHEGGGHQPENLRLLCHAHHKWRHEREMNHSKNNHGPDRGEKKC